MMPRPVCVKCQIEFRRERSGVVADFRTRACGSYEAYSADLWVCPDCGARILAGYGHDPISRHFDTRHQDVIADPDVLRVYESVGHRIDEENR